MSEILIGEILLDIALLLGLTFLLGGLLAKLRIPIILGALVAAMVVHYTPLGTRLLSQEIYPELSLLADLGVMFLLFFIGLQIDLKEMRSQSGDIVWLTILNTIFPFLFGMLLMLFYGYGWLLAFIIGLTRMPTAEAVIVPILDDFRLIRTKVGRFIVGAGVLDDVIEVFLVAFVSVWIGEKAAAGTGVGAMIENEVISITLSIILFLLFAWIGYRWLLPWLGRLLPRHPRNLILLCAFVLFALGGYAEHSELGMVVGAITAGVILRPVFRSMGVVGEQTTRAIHAFTYGFFGLIFFYWVGLSVDLGGIVQFPMLTILLYLAGTLGKLLGAFIMVPMKKMSAREALVVGVGIDARLTTEIIVAKLLLDAKLIDADLFTALVAAASFTAITVPLLFTLLVRLWGEQLRSETTV